MNRFKFSIFGTFAICSLFFTIQTFAIDTIPAPVATVNIQDAKIVSQKGNIFDLSFNISNREGLQTGVKYGVELIQDNSGKQYIVDEKVYDESLTLYENSTIKKEVTYTAPGVLSGSYTLLLVSNNESDFPFAMTTLGQIKLSAITKGISILNDTCYLQVEGEKGSPHYTLSQGIDISGSESLRLTCDAVNGASTSISGTPSFETRYLSAYGKVALQTPVDAKLISFAKNEKKTVSLIIPKGTTPQFYYLKFALINNDSSSNAVSMGYIIRG